MTKRMERRQNTLNLTIASGGALSEAFDMSLHSMGVIRMPAAWTAASVGFTVAGALAGTYLPLYDDDGNLVQIDSPAADKAYSFPPEVAGCAFVKLWSQNGSGTNTNQGGDRVIGVDLKS